jgi:hypothetical protein
MGQGGAAALFVFRPWMLLAAALIAQGRRWPERLLLYGLALLLALLAESAMLLMLGATDPWSAGLRGLMAGAGLALVFDMLVRLGRRFGRAGLAGALVLGVAVLLVPGALRPYEALVLGTAPPLPTGPKPDLMLLTGLPLIWGEAGPFEPQSRPAAALSYLEGEFTLRPLDAATPDALAAGKLLLLAQPQRLAPEELVAIDSWMRRGGRALVLSDPALIWPTELPLGDIRRPPPIGLLGPLLARWGLELAPGEPGLATLQTADGRLVTAAPGRFEARAPSCRLEHGGLIAHCLVGRGRALLVADADLLHDALWLPGGASDPRLRTADNPQLVADWLDRLAGLDRERAAAPIQWIARDANTGLAVGLGFAALLLAGLAGLALTRVSRG